MNRTCAAGVPDSTIMLVRGRYSYAASSLDPGAQGEKADGLLAQLQGMAKLGVHEAHGWVPRVSEITPLELLGREVVPAAKAF
jgi:hypothetical protein